MLFPACSYRSITYAATGTRSQPDIACVSGGKFSLLAFKQHGNDKQIAGGIEISLRIDPADIFFLRVHL